MQRRIADTEVGLDQNASRIREVQAQRDHEASSLPLLDQALTNAEQGLHEAGIRQHELRAQQEEQQIRLDNLRSAEAHTRASLEFLIGLVDTTESSKFLMSSDEWQPSGEKHTLAEVLNTSDELRVAIEAALGDAARYFVVANREEANQAISALSKNNVGKATFLCRDAIPNLPEPPAAELGGGIYGWASELVSCDDTLRGAVRGILGRTVIADNLDSAWKAVTQGHADRAVTLSGEVVHRAGAVRGGSTSRTEGVRVGRRERIEQLRGELARLEADVAGGLAAVQALKDEYSAIDLRALADVVRLATVARNTVQQKLDSLQGRLADLQAARESMLMDADKHRSDLKAHEDARLRIDEQMSAVHSRLEQADGVANDLDQRVKTAEQTLEHALLQVREAEILAVRLDGELTSLQSNESRLSNHHLSIGQRSEQRAAEMEQLQADRDQIKADIERTREQVGLLTGSLTEVASNRQSVEFTLQESIATVHAATEAVRQQRRIVEALVNEQHDADLKLNAAVLRIEQLEHHSAQELELEATDLASAAEQVATMESPNADVLREQAQELRRKLTQMGNVNFLALEEHERENERLVFMSTQLADLLSSEQTLTQAILEINQTARELFTSTFESIRQNFTQLFKLLFSEDDEADLQMIETEENDPLECKVEIIAKPRGKRPHSIEMLSGGEKTLTAIALLFAIYLVKPSPFCILDEVDAPLDDANIDRYLKIIRKFSENTQFLMITHNKRTMEAADTLYGVTMEEPAVSKVVSVKFGERSTNAAREAA